MDEPRRPEAAEVARRILVVSTVVARVRMECRGDARPEAARTLVTWLRRHDLHESASVRELKFLSAPAGRASQREIVQLSWRNEACAILAWAGERLSELPSWDAVADPAALLDALAGAHRDPRAFIATARLRPKKELDRARDTAELWHWRAKTAQRAREGAKPQAGKPPLDELIRRTAQHAREMGDIPALIDDDFPALGKAYRELNGEEYATMHSIALERHFALNWLCGYSEGADWESTPTET
ncbi:MAG: DUF4272 domain-containing protein [Planctomycetes bacterium]|nr:DUF4272 domain-containing protein [Planctomycetota bacterium]